MTWEQTSRWPELGERYATVVVKREGGDGVAFADGVGEGEGAVVAVGDDEEAVVGGDVDFGGGVAAVGGEEGDCAGVGELGEGEAAVAGEVGDGVGGDYVDVSLELSVSVV